MKYVRTLIFQAVALAVMSVTSHAQQLASTFKDVNLRAGPSRDYPVVAILRAGISISVEGCLSNYRWCDVVVGSNRGWVYAKNILYPYQGVNVPVLTYGAMIGIGIIVFNVGNYWDEHYRFSPWYPQRQRWMDRARSNFSRVVPYKPIPIPRIRPRVGQPQPQPQPQPQLQLQLQLQLQPGARGPDRGQHPPHGQEPQGIRKR